jgi:hypothetical protein
MNILIAYLGVGLIVALLGIPVGILRKENTIWQDVAGLTLAGILWPFTGYLYVRWMIKKVESPICAWCGAESSRDPDEIRAHILVCEKHPMRAEIEQTQAELKALRREIIDKPPQERECCMGCTLPAENEQIRKLQAQVVDEKKNAEGWKSEWKMYADAWLREIGGETIAKTHLIDALVLTTREKMNKLAELEAAQSPTEGKKK